MDRRLILMLVILAGLAVGGFLLGSSDGDYSFDRGLGAVDEAGDGAPTYAQLRDRNELSGQVARGCEDCHEDYLIEARSGQRRTHPVGVGVPGGADLAGLLAAGGQVLVSEAHPEGEVACRTCHRPHGVESDGRLVVTADEGALCLSCHKSKSPSRSHHPTVAGDLSCLSCHDPHEAVAGRLLRTNEQGATRCRSCHQPQAEALGKGHGGEDCASCHGMHVSRAPAALVTPVAEDGRCVACHEGQQEHGHPVWVATEDGEDGQVGCWDCHEPHGQRQGLPAEASVGATCAGCHDEQASVLGGPHDATLHPMGGSKLACVSCHEAHEEPAATRSGVNPASARCLACHEDDLAAWTHSTSLLTTTSGLPFEPPGPSPYFDGSGQRTRRKGEITCQSCHDHHAANPGLLRPEEQLVPYCGVCHGADGDEAFRGFHDPQVRESLLAE